MLGNRHLWGIVAIMCAGGLVYYADQLPLFRDIVTQAPVQLTRYSTHRILSLMPVGYAAYVFRFYGGLATVLFISLALLPRALFISRQPEDVAEIVAFLFIGLLVSWLIDRQRHAVHRLENTQRELIDSLETVRAIAGQLRLSDERYRGLFENASEAIFVCSGAGRIISVNRAGEELTGYTSAQLTGATMYQLFSGIGREAIEEMLLEKAERVTIGKAEELSLKKRDGTEAFVELRASPVLRDGRAIGWQAIARDVTEERRLNQNMQYYVAQITRAQEEERLRISRELHDETAQVLAGLSRGLDAVASEAELAPATLAALAKLHDMADSVLKGVRRFSQDLRPSLLDDLGLVPALEWLASATEGQGIAVEFAVAGEKRRLASEKELAVFRITQEALTNVRRHSQASAVRMTIDFDADALTLTVHDNGQGFSLPRRVSDLASSGRLGLVGMRERARLVGGTLLVESEPGRGTTVVLRMPG